MVYTKISAGQTIGRGRARGSIELIRTGATHRLDRSTETCLTPRLENRPDLEFDLPSARFR